MGCGARWVSKGFSVARSIRSRIISPLMLPALEYQETTSRSELDRGEGGAYGLTVSAGDIETVRDPAEVRPHRDNPPIVLPVALRLSSIKGDTTPEPLQNSLGSILLPGDGLGLRGLAGKSHRVPSRRPAPWVTSRVTQQAQPPKLLFLENFLARFDALRAPSNFCF